MFMLWMYVTIWNGLEPPYYKQKINCKRDGNLIQNIKDRMRLKNNGC